MRTPLSDTGVMENTCPKIGFARSDAESKIAIARTSLLEKGVILEKTVAKKMVTL